MFIGFSRQSTRAFNVNKIHSPFHNCQCAWIASRIDVSNDKTRFSHSPVSIKGQLIMYELNSAISF